MTDTIREQIIGKFTARAAMLTVANGFNSDMGLNVLRAVRDLGPSDPPCLVVWPLPEESEQRYGKDYIAMQVRIEGFLIHGDQNSSVVAEIILGDLRKCFTDPAAFASAYGGLVDELEYVSGGTDTFAQAGEEFTGNNIVLSVRYHTLTGDPYNQT